MPEIDKKKNRSRRPTLSTAEYVRGILEQNRAVMARAITLIESNAAAHFEQAQAVLNEILPHTGRSIRIGITGIPGAGKSTLIEALGLYLLENGHKVAVLAIDPSSSISGGSILGDKTRMAGLGQHPHSFIRPSPSAGALGGVSRKTRETILVCEAAGYDIIIVETVGVGQNEITVRSMVDFFLLLQIAGGGDELQGIKKGVIELADAICINKAEGENKARAEAARQELNMALHYLAPATPDWQTRCFTCSALTGEGIPELWRTVLAHQKITTANGYWTSRRQKQNLDWMHALIDEQLRTLFQQHPRVRELLPEIEAAVTRGELLATAAAHRLLQVFAHGDAAGMGSKREEG